MVLGQKMIELLSKTNRISQRGLIWSFLVIWALGVAIFWPGEEPAKVNTLLVVGIVFVLAYLIIAYAAKSKIITSKIYWMVAFLVMMTLVAIVLQFVLTVSDIGHRDIDGFDPIRYDYDAKAAVESGLDFTAAKGSYNFLGVIYYIAGIYWMFGISTFYVSLFNLLFVLVGFLAVTKILIDQTGQTGRGGLPNLDPHPDPLFQKVDRRQVLRVFHNDRQRIVRFINRIGDYFVGLGQSIRDQVEQFGG